MRMSRWWKASDATSDGLNVAVLRRTEAQSEAAFMGGAVFRGCGNIGQYIGAHAAHRHGGTCALAAAWRVRRV